MSKHTKPHTYRIVVLKKEKVAQCAIQNCYHYIPLALALGKESSCNYCGNPFKLSRRKLRLSKPHCGCRSAKLRAVAEEEKKHSALLDAILGGVK